MARRRLHVNPPPRIWERSKQAVLFVFGLAGIVYETIVAHVDRPYLLAGFFGMVGLPAFIGRDRRQGGGDEPDS